MVGIPSPLFCGHSSSTPPGQIFPSAFQIRSGATLGRCRLPYRFMHIKHCLDLHPLMPFLRPPSSVAASPDRPSLSLCRFLATAVIPVITPKWIISHPHVIQYPIENYYITDKFDDVIRGVNT